MKYYENEISLGILDDLVKKTIQSLVSDHCYLSVHREELASYEFILTERLYHDIQKLFQQLDENGNVQLFYTSFFSTITFEPLKYFPNLSYEMATLLCTRLADSLLEFYQKPQHSVQNQPTPLSLPENDSLEYLAGYVIHKLLKKN